MANRNAQGYFLGSNYIVGALPNSQNTLTGTAQVPLLLEQIVLAGADDSIVTAMRLAGQNLFRFQSLTELVDQLTLAMLSVLLLL